MKNFIYTGFFHTADIDGTAISFALGNEYSLDENNPRVKRMIALGDLSVSKSILSYTETKSVNNKQRIKGGN